LVPFFFIANKIFLFYYFEFNIHARGNGNEGLIIKTPYFGLLRPHEMFRDDLWWNTPAEIEKIPPIVDVMPKHNPMVAKAEQVFKDALKK
jgi:hypothetical protein